MQGDRERVWEERVAAWRASGLSSEEFSRGREFTAGGLRHWAYLLRRRKKARPAASARRAEVRMARVAVTAAQGDAKAMPSEDKPEPSVAWGGVVPARDGTSGVVLEVGSVRILLSSRFDRRVLADVLAVVGDGGAR